MSFLTSASCPMRREVIKRRGAEECQLITIRVRYEVKLTRYLFEVIVDICR